MKGEKKTIKPEGDEWVEEQDLILFRGKVNVMKNIELRRETTQLHHDLLTAGHPG
jgi:hypothetical protein